MSNQYESVGTLHKVYDTQQVKDTFKKREFVIEVQDGEYPQHIKFQVTQDRCELLDKYKVGQEVTVLFNLRGRPFQNKDGQTMYFTNLEAWRIEGPTQPSGTDYSGVKKAGVPTFNADFDVPF